MIGGNEQSNVEWGSEEEELCNEDLGNIDPRFISQSATSYFQKTGKSRGRKTNKQRKEEEVMEKRFMSIKKFLSRSKGLKNSLGG